MPPESLKALARQLQSPAAPSAGIIHCSIGCMKARSGGMGRQPIGVAVSEAGETKLKFSEEVRPAALRVEQNVCVSTDIRREIDHRLCSVCVWRWGQRYSARRSNSIPANSITC